MGYDSLAFSAGLSRWGMVMDCLANGVAAVMDMGFPSGSGVGKTAENRCGSADSRLAVFVGAVESGARDDVSGHGVECVGEGEPVWQVELVVKGEELEDVGV